MKGQEQVFPSFVGRKWLSKPNVMNLPLISSTTNTFKELMPFVLRFLWLVPVRRLALRANRWRFAFLAGNPFVPAPFATIAFQSNFSHLQSIIVYY